MIRKYLGQRLNLCASLYSNIVVLTHFFYLPGKSSRLEDIFYLRVYLFDITSFIEP